MSFNYGTWTLAVEVEVDDMLSNPRAITDQHVFHSWFINSSTAIQEMHPAVGEKFDFYFDSSGALVTTLWQV